METMEMIIRKPFTRQRLAKTFSQPSRTKQAFADDCDVNKIVAKYEKTGLAPDSYAKAVQYGYAPAVDFSEACRIVIEAQEQFGELPARVRDRFDNDPGAFLEFINDPQNAAEASKLGILSPEAIERINAENAAKAASGPSAEPPAKPDSDGQATSEKAQLPT